MLIMDRYSFTSYPSKEKEPTVAWDSYLTFIEMFITDSEFLHVYLALE